MLEQLLEQLLVDGIQVRQIPGYSNYWVSSHGAVWSTVKRGRWIAKTRNKDSFYRMVKFKVGSSVTIERIHRLVALCWIGFPPEDKPYVLHRNDVKNDNCVLNLYYGDHEDNGKDGIRNDCYSKGEEHGKVTLEGMKKNGYVPPSGTTHSRAISAVAAKGEESGNAKLTNEQAEQLKRRALAGELQSILANEFSVTISTVSRIKNGKSRKHLEQHP